MQKIINWIKENIFLIFIVLLALALRIALISYNPPSLNWDEISHGFNAYSILKTGKDEWGNLLPIIFKAYGDYKLPLYIYLTAFSEALLGLNALAVRLPSILSGVGIVIVTYYLVLKLLKNTSLDEKKVALLSALLIAIEPWGFFFSRIALEANLALVLVLLGIYFFLSGLEKPKKFIYSALFFGLSVWTYNSARIFVPLIVLSGLLIYWKDIKTIFKRTKNTMIFSTVILFVFLLPMFYQLIRPVGLARYEKVAILDQGAIAQIEESRNNSKLPTVLNRLVNNKVTYFSGRFITNWTKHYSIDFLFLKGGSNYQFSVPGYGLLLWVNIIFLFIGFIWLIQNLNRKLIFFSSWLFLATIPSALTNEAPHALRSILLLPTPMILSAIGFFACYNTLSKFESFKLFSKKISTSNILSGLLITIYSLVLITLAENYYVNYFTSYRTNYSWSWQYGYKEVVSYLKSNQDKYEKIIITKKYGEPHEFVLFYWPWDPAKYLSSSNLNRFYQSGWYWIDSFDKFYFVNDWDMPSTGKVFVTESKVKIDCQVSKCLLVTSPDNFPKGWEKLKTINFINGKSAFEIYEN